MNEFYMLYQAKFFNGKITSLEALLRLHHTDNIEAYVKEYPDPVNLDISVIEQVIIDIIESNITIPISINISYLSFIDKTFIDFCLQKLTNTNVILELTEYHEIDDLNLLRDNIETLKDNNIKISLDDFGKGISVTSLLTEINFDQVKIDKSLIDNIENNYSKYKHLSFLTEKIKSFGVENIVYEGVEKKEQENLIKLFNNNPIIQGYLYSKPSPLKNYLLCNIMNNNSFNYNLKENNTGLIEKLIYNLVLSKNKDIINQKIKNLDVFNNIYNQDYKKTISNFNNLYYGVDNKITANSIFSILDNSERMVVIRNSYGVIIYENKAHQSFMGCSNIDIPLNEILKTYPDYYMCIDDDNKLLNSTTLHSMKKEIFNNKTYYAIRQKILLNNEFFIMVTIYEENKGNFASQDSLTNFLLRDSIVKLNDSGIFNGKVIAFLDLDGFKLINDSFGHNKGDQVLLDFSKLIRSHIRKRDNQDEIIRYGGDEFLILFNSENRKFIKDKLDFINNEVVDFFKKDNITLSFSYGLELNSINDIEKTIQLADKKLYIQKFKKKNLI